MIIPVNFSSINIWLIVTVVVLLVTMELSSTYYGRTSLQINRQRLQNVALVVFGFFAISTVITAISVIS